MIELARLLGDAAARLGDCTDAEWLLLHVLDRPRSWLVVHASDLLDTDVQTAVMALVERRAAGEPVAYITGRQGFWSMELEVGPATLIPRPETELLVELALTRLPPQWALRALDLGTGSGAVALALARERPDLHITATDASGEALAVARRNADRLGLPQVRLLQGSWFEPLAGETFDLIVSNPPYIESADPHLLQGDLRFEPAGALSSGIDGLDAVRQITRQARAHLRPGGWLLLEHGWNQGAAVASLLREAELVQTATVQDLERRDRVTLGARPVS